MANTLLSRVNEAKKIWKILADFRKKHGWPALIGLLAITVLVVFLGGTFGGSLLSNLLQKKHDTPSVSTQQSQTQNQTVHIGPIIVGQATPQPSTTKNPTLPPPSPTKGSTLGMAGSSADCTDKLFAEHTEEWDLSLYHLISGDGFYAPTPKGSSGYKFPPIRHLGPVTPAFKVFKLHYQLRNSDQPSSPAASLYVGIQEFRYAPLARTVFYLNIPAPGGKTIELRSMDMTAIVPTIIQDLPIYLRYKMEDEVTGTIDLAAEGMEADGMHYQLGITYTPEGGGKPVNETHDFAVQLPTDTLSDKNFYLIFGVYNTGIIAPIEYTICDNG